YICLLFSSSFTHAASLEIFTLSLHDALPIFQIGTRRVDFLVEEHLSVEIKAVIDLGDVHLAQAMNYLEAYNLEIGLLINFGARSLEFKRLHNNLNHD